MKKAVKINLSGQIFHIDEDAYEKLKTYLDTISSHFSNTNESKEILSDIESRIAELFREKMSDENQVVSVNEVDEIINIMGRPEEIVDEEEMSGSQKNREQRASRRLYRDPDNAVLGGVSAGLSAYFVIDVLLIRILFVVLTLIGFGAPILLYIILWIAVPKAITSAEKLEMRGEKVTVSNIEKTVKEEYEEVKENLKKARNSEGFRRTEDGIMGLFKAIGKIIIVASKIFLGFIAIVLILVGLGLLFTTVYFAFFGTHFIPFGSHGSLNYSFSELIAPFVNPQNASIFIIAIMFIILIPVLSLVYGLFKIIFRFKAKDKTLGFGALSLWLLALVTACMLIYYEGRNYQDINTSTETISMDLFQSDTLFLSINNKIINEFESENTINIDNKWYLRDDPKSLYSRIEINAKKSLDSCYKFRIEKIARGLDKETAGLFAKKITYGFTQKDSSLILDPYFLIDNEGPWRAQSVEITVYVPVGKSIKFDKNTEVFLGWINNTEDYSDWEVAGKTFIMNPDGLSLP